MASRRRSFPLVGLVPVGVLVGHTAAYRVSGHSDHGGAHHYLPMAWGAALAIVLALLVQSARRSRNGGGAPRVPPLGVLAAAQTAVFVLQETLEHVAVGHGLTWVLHAPVVRVGVVLQVAVALAVVVAVRAARAVGVFLALALRVRPLTWPARPWFVVQVAATRVVADASPVGPSSRAPPTGAVPV